MIKVWHHYIDSQIPSGFLSVLLKRTQLYCILFNQIQPIINWLLSVAME